ncbi:hypothetical protein [Endozoicomonas lisbonensis]
MLPVSLYTLIPIFLVLLTVDGSLAAPFNSTTQTPPSTTTATTTAGGGHSAFRDKLSGYCNGTVHYGDLNLDDTVISSVVTAVENFRTKHPEEKISQCVIKIPDNSALDEAILSFNEGKLPSEVYGTAFLLLGKGVRTSGEGKVESCHLRAYRFAGNPQSQLSAIQDGWEDSYQVRESIPLAAGQKLIAVPLNINTSALAGSYYVNLKRTITGQIRCKKYSTDFTGFDVDRDYLIRLLYPGVVVSGFTNIIDMNEKATLKGTCTRKGRRGYIFSKSHEGEVDAYLGYSGLIKAEIDPKLVTPGDALFYVISGNEFFQVKEPAIDIAFKQGSDSIHSNRMDNMTFVQISNNRLYSCHPRISGSLMSPVMNINTYYQDDAQNPETIHALTLAENQLMTKGRTAVKLLAAPNTETIIKKNSFITSGRSISDSRGVILTGTNHLKDTSRPRPGFSLKDNHVAGFQDALLLDGALRLELNSNQLNGNKSAVARVPGQLTDPVTLSGDRGNRYLKKVASPCEGLELSNIKGGFLFVDGTPCPSDYSAATPPP